VSRSRFTELLRRTVFRMDALYLVAAWLIIQTSGTATPAVAPARP